jgi:hypothetical protein
MLFSLHTYYVPLDSVGVQEIRQGALQQLELLIHGLAPGDLTSPSRRLIRQVGPWGPHFTLQEAY